MIRVASPPADSTDPPSMKRFKTVTIVGVGLIVGSVGLAIRRRRLADQVVGVGRRARSLQKAKALGTVDRTTTDLAKGVAGAQLVVVCTPVASITEHVRQVAAACPAGTLITDAGSTKMEIVRELEGSLANDVHFVGSHPLAGDHRTGPEHAREDLFQGRTVVVTSTPKSRKADVATLRQFWTALGAEVEVMTPAKHDRAVAATSHLPHVMAAALAAATPDAYRSLIATGWLDTTRVAAGDPDLWQQILFANRQNVLKEIGRMEKSVARLRTALEQQDARRLVTFLTKAKRSRDAVGS